MNINGFMCKDCFCFKQIREELESKSETVEAAVKLAEELAASLEASPAAAAQVHVQLQSTRQHWMAICKHLNDRLKVLTDAFERWKEFQGTVRVLHSIAYASYIVKIFKLLCLES